MTLTLVRVLSFLCSTGCSLTFVSVYVLLWIVHVLYCVCLFSLYNHYPFDYCLNPGSLDFHFKQKTCQCILIKQSLNWCCYVNFIVVGTHVYYSVLASNGADVIICNKTNEDVFEMFFNEVNPFCFQPFFIVTFLYKNRLVCLKTTFVSYKILTVVQIRSNTILSACMVINRSIFNRVRF